MLDTMFSEDDVIFKKELNSLLDKLLPTNWAHYPDETDDFHWELSKKIKLSLSIKNWIAPSWPKEYGGGGKDITKAIILSETMAYRMSPGNDRFATRMIGPTILKYGTSLQKKQFLSEITSGKVQWCQGYSEPNSGSDLASITTKGDYNEETETLTINGTKIWTTLANRANRMFILVRSQPGSERHQGLTFAVLDMDNKGITVNPIKNIAGKFSFNEVILKNVKISSENIIGKLHEGWKIALDLLNFERSGIDYIGWAERCLDDLISYSKKNKLNKNEMIFNSEAFKKDVAILKADLESAKIMTYKAIWKKSVSDDIHMEPSMSKILATEINNKVHDYALEILKDQIGFIDENPQNNFVQRILNHRLFFVSGGILAGTNEIQKNIIAQRGLGFPK